MMPIFFHYFWHSRLNYNDEKSTYWRVFVRIKSKIMFVSMFFSQVLIIRCWFPVLDSYVSCLVSCHFGTYWYWIFRYPEIIAKFSDYNTFDWIVKWLPIIFIVFHIMFLHRVFGIEVKWEENTEIRYYLVYVWNMIM